MSSEPNSLGGTAVDTDSSLVALVEQRDEQAMARLYERHSNLVYAIALRILHDPAAAEDVSQEVFMQIWRKPTSFIGTRGNLGSFLAIMCRNRSIDQLRRRRPTESIDNIPMASAFDLATDSERRLLLEKVKVVIAELPTEQRNVLQMAFFKGMTHHEIADESGSPLGTVKTRMRSALQTLGKAFKA